MGGKGSAELPTLKLKKGGTRRLRLGHPWIFSNELQDVPQLLPGSIVRVESPGGETAGTGYFNPRCLISVRLLQRGPGALGPKWLEERVEAACARRSSAGAPGGCARLIYSEGDSLPGLVVDRYGEAVVLQVKTAGMELLRERVEESVRRAVSPKMLVRKDDDPLRALEGLPLGVELLPVGSPEHIPVEYAGLKLSVPLVGGQKTGLFLDQRENVAEFVRLLSPGSTVLDVFCYMGVWGMSAYRAGASEVEFVDASAPACAAVERALAENGLPESDIHNGDAVEVLKRLVAAGRSFDAVVCDPPAFAKSARHFNEAAKAYERLNSLAMRLVKPGGLLVTCSCSYHVPREAFAEIIAGSAARARRRAFLLGLRGQATDHPVLLGFPEGEYLKAAFLRLE